MSLIDLPKRGYTIGVVLILFATVTISSVSNVRSQPPGGPRGPGGPDAPDQMIVEKYDSDGDGVLNAAERKIARADLESVPQNRRRRRGPRRPSAGGKPGPKVAINDATAYPDAPFYDTSVLRTLFLEFENEDWEKELATFKPTDVEVAANMVVDGKQYPNVGVSFRGASSFFMIPEGLKRSLNLSIDFIDEDQRLYGYKSLNLLNCNGDPSMMSSIVYSYLSRQHIAAPKVNYVKVVINGESWGLYVSSQQFNKTFLNENYGSSRGARWKVHGSPRGDGGLRYLGEEFEPYRERFEIKSKDKTSSWNDLIELCRVLNESPADELEAKLTPILDIDGVLWFLAVDVATSNSDGYWTRASDYNIYKDDDGKFHILPHDMNEAFQVARHRGPGGPSGPGRGGPPGGRGNGGRGNGGRGNGGRGNGGRGNGGPAARDRDASDRRGPPADQPPNERAPGDRPPRDDGPPPRDAPPENGFGERPPRGRGADGGERGPGGGRRGGPGGREGAGGRRGGGPGGGPRHGGVELEPLVGLDDERMPLRSVLLNNPKWQRKYLQNLKEIAMLMQWENLGPQIAQYRELIDKEVALDTRKLFTTDQFRAASDGAKPKAGATSFRAFADRRSAFLLNHEKIKALGE